jgi:hypothetical protein
MGKTAEICCDDIGLPFYLLFILWFPSSGKAVEIFLDDIGLPFFLLFILWFLSWEIRWEKLAISFL